MRSIKVYIAGPYSQGDVEANVEVAMRTWLELWAVGYIPYCAHWTYFQNKFLELPYDDWLEFDGYWLESCDAVLRLPGPSRGADMEVTAATQLGMSVYNSTTELLKGLPPNGKPATRKDSSA